MATKIRRHRRRVRQGTSLLRMLRRHWLAVLVARTVASIVLMIAAHVIKQGWR
jgi:hypothetical protein